MPDIRAEVDQLNQITNPLERAQRALEAMEDARTLQAELGKVRGLAVYEMFAQFGAAKAARLLGISRAGLYRIIAQHAPEDVKAKRAQTAAEILAAMATMQREARALSEIRALEQGSSETES